MRFRSRGRLSFRAEARQTINTRQYETGLRRVLGRMSDDVARAVDRTRIDVQNEARRRAPVKTGRLRSSIVSRAERSGRSVGYLVGTNVVYARAIEYGLDEFDIFPKNKKALYWPGARHPVAKVHHPGIEAQPYLRPAIEMTEIFFRANLSQIRGR
ncbi:HK97 gp10 family phage protein [Streptomyces sp. NPDC048109]|uniref:HK97 gp10 family phage protein n=1 Tax=Streptomyces sp. NPDC048109 TaxID=3155482 RepID=UPI0034304D5B